MLGFIEIVFSLLGIIGYFQLNETYMIIGLTGIIIGDIIDFLTGHNMFTVFICILLSIGATIGNHNPLYNFTIFLCGENLIMSSLVIILLIISFLCGFLYKLFLKKNKNKLDENKNTKDK